MLSDSEFIAVRIRTQREVPLREAMKAESNTHNESYLLERAELCMELEEIAVAATTGGRQPKGRQLARRFAPQRLQHRSVVNTVSIVHVYAQLLLFSRLYDWRQTSRSVIALHRLPPCGPERSARESETGPARRDTIRCCAR